MRIRERIRYGWPSLTFQIFSDGHLPPIKTLKIGQVLKTGEQNENITNRLLWFRLIVQQHKKRIFIILELCCTFTCFSYMFS
ncbi:hypothetical protein B9Z55_011457 [Caenorhabditis nigoni]|uniref:Uncharacterized protein n=1 Tax=Caenorhabditis nigoni TaxID=1611254 RepID=A0A2G5UL20_9PELO|nr:hypothetical protein B9Z55_011457 [Caenorhabditis nigoni]